MIDRLRTMRVWMGAFVTLGGLVIVLMPAPQATSAPTRRLFRVNAEMFDYSPSVIRVSKGDTVSIELSSMDVVHGLYVDGYDVSLSADPGQTARLSFIADRPGSFRFRCSITCGPLHPFMIGLLKVGPNWLFWRATALAVVFVALGMLGVRR